LTRRQAGVLAFMAGLAAFAGLDLSLVTSSGGPAQERAVPVAAQLTPAASSQVPAPQAGPGQVPPGSATTPAPPVVETPPPVVDGVRRINVGSAHSPRLLQQLSAAPATMPPPADAGALGVDVADHQHPGGAAIDWPQVAAAGYKFAFIKATEGDYYANPYYAADLAQAKAAGLYATEYHFAIPNVSDGASQADYAVGNGSYAAVGRTLPLALDIEYNPYGPECYGLSTAQMAAWVAAFTTEVQRLTGQPPIIYSTADWWDTCTGGSTAFGADPLWIAGYTSGSPPMPAGWGNWTFWQYTSRGSVPGITGHVDLSYFLQAAMGLLAPGTQPASPRTQSPAASSSPPFLLPSSDTPSPLPSDSTSPADSTAASDSAPASPTDSPAPTDAASSPAPDSPTPTDSTSPTDPPSGPPSPTPTDSACASPTPTDPASPPDSPSPTPTDSTCACAAPPGPASPSDPASPTDSPAPADSACTPSPTESAAPSPAT
jgi:GH25 family lysozyme M1 (1,4-beta-N-acetylmuramidase)